VHVVSGCFQKIYLLLFEKKNFLVAFDQNPAHHRLAASHSIVWDITPHLENANVLFTDLHALIFGLDCSSPGYQECCMSGAKDQHPE
jgi:hypothetical protein